MPDDHSEPSGDTPPGRPVASDSLLGRRLSDRYELLGMIGLGGAGHVYEAVQHPLGRRVAVKVMRTDIGATARNQFAQRFLREAALAGRLHHPNIVTVHDFGDDDGVLYVVMELLQGRTLHKALKDGPIPSEEAARIGIGVARGLRHAHEQGLVHRDVKPLNVMLVRDDEGREQPKLMDFGLVKSMRTEDESMTVVGQFMGTPAFMSPEQARGQAVDERTDLYALGVMLFRMLTGKLPFEADHPLGFAVLHQTEPVPAMAAVAPEARISEELEQIVRRAMAKKPDDRFPDAAAMAEALDRWLQWRTRPSDTVPPPEVVVTEGPAPAARSTAPVVLALGSVLVGLVGLLLVGVGAAGLGVGLLTGWTTGGSPPVAAPAPLPPPTPPEPAADPAPAPPTPETAPPPAPRAAARPRATASPREAAARRPAAQAVGARPRPGARRRPRDRRGPHDPRAGRRAGGPGQPGDAGRARPVGRLRSGRGRDPAAPAVRGRAGVRRDQGHRQEDGGAAAGEGEVAHSTRISSAVHEQPAPEPQKCRSQGAPVVPTPNPAWTCVGPSHDPGSRDDTAASSQLGGDGKGGELAGPKATPSVGSGP
jgi:hypothetical protein